MIRANAAGCEASSSASTSTIASQASGRRAMIRLPAISQARPPSGSITAGISVPSVVT